MGGGRIFLRNFCCHLALGPPCQRAQHCSRRSQKGNKASLSALCRDGLVRRQGVSILRERHSSISILIGPQPHGLLTILPSPLLHLVHFAASLEVGDCVPAHRSATGRTRHMPIEWAEVFVQLLWLVLKLLVNRWNKSRPHDRRRV